MFMLYKSKPNKNCIICGALFYAPPYAVAKGYSKYCSRKCHGKGRAVALDERFWRYVNKTANGCWLWTSSSITTSGYGQLLIRDEGRKYHVMMHRLSWEIHYGTIPEGQHVLHKCDVRLCVNPDHLFLGSHQDNMADMVSKGRQNRNRTRPAGIALRGEQIGNSVLTEDNVKEIRRSYADKSMTQHALAKKFKVDVMTINSAIHRRSWKHVE